MGGLLAFALQQTWGSSRAAWYQEYVLFHILLFALGLRWWEQIPLQSVLSGFAVSKSFSAWTSLGGRWGGIPLSASRNSDIYHVSREKHLKKKKQAQTLERTKINSGVILSA